MRIVRVRPQAVAHGASLASAERRRAGVEGAVHAHQVDVLGAELAMRALERRGVRRLHRPVAAVAAAVVGGADRAAAGVGDRAQAGRAVRDHHAHGAAALALDADAVRAHAGPAAGRWALITSSSWRLLIGQPCSSKSTGTWALIGVEVPASRCSRARRRRSRVNSSTSAKLRSAWIPPAVAQAPIVISARELRADLLDALGVVRRGDRALDQRDVVGALDGRARGLEEVGDLERVRRARAARPRSRAG